jgi:hypothetical protein
MRRPWSTGGCCVKKKQRNKKEPIAYIPIFYGLFHVANSKTEVDSVKYFSLEKVSTDGKA